MTTSKAHVAYLGARDGIHVYAHDPETSALTPLSSTEAGSYPSFLTVAPDRRHLYAVNEPGDALASFAIGEGGSLSLSNRVACPGGPCYVATDRTGHFVFAASYDGGTAYVFPVLADGSLGPARQTLEPGPCAHCIVTDPSNRFAFTACLGSDRIVQYVFDAKAGELTPNEVPFVATAKGAGPRHIAFHPSAKYAYVINELDSTMGAYAFDERTGRLSPIQTITTLPAGFSGKNDCADVHVAPSGRFLYGSNRGHDSIVIYSIDETTGHLELFGHEPTGGKTPRNFGLDPSGRFLYAANQDSNTVVSFRVDETSGKLTRLATLGTSAAPYYIGFARLSP
jgi:6-phosphogluconolactonase